MKDLYVVVEFEPGSEAIAAIFENFGDGKIVAKFESSKDAEYLVKCETGYREAIGILRDIFSNARLEISPAMNNRIATLLNNSMDKI